jgi:hypothetical protein
VWVEFELNSTMGEGFFYFTDAKRRAKKGGWGTGQKGGFRRERGVHVCRGGERGSFERRRIRGG